MRRHALAPDAGFQRLLTPAQLAEWLQVKRAYVYEHAAEFGAIRLGSGKRARIRFDADDVRRRLNTCQVGRKSPKDDLPANPRVQAARRSRTAGTTVPLLPIRGQIRGESRPESEAA